MSAPSIQDTIATGRQAALTSDVLTEWVQKGTPGNRPSFTGFS